LIIPNLGKVARSHIKTNIKKKHFRKKKNTGGITKIPKNLMEKTGVQPPKNKLTIKKDINKILAYSAKKNKTNTTEEYSVLSRKLVLTQPQVNQKALC
jgi:hypothetical protein